MSDDELRGLAGDYVSLTADGGERFVTEPVADAGRLARRLLELLPPADDAEPVTEEWLKSVGWEWRPEWACWSNAGGVVCISLFRSRTAPGEWRLQYEADFAWPHPINTRGQFRRLIGLLQGGG